MNKQEMLEHKDFPGLIGDLLRDELSDQQSAMLAYYVVNRDDGECARLLREILSPVIKSAFEVMKERYPDWADGPVCSTGYSAEDEDKARQYRRNRAKECNR